MRIVAIFLLVAMAQTAGEASVFHWTTRLLHMNCDTHTVTRGHNPELVPRSGQADQVTAQDFAAERPFSAGTKLTLGVCNGEVHILPGGDAGKLKITVHLAAPLGHERTPQSYLQIFAFDDKGADIEWKLPEAGHPVVTVYLPEHADLDLELGKAELDVTGIRGNKHLSLGKGTARLHVASGNSEYSRMTVDVAMGSFRDWRPDGLESHKVPLHQEFLGTGSASARIEVAMGKAEIAPE